MGKSVVVLGTQWGDEGKGKIVDFLTAKADAVVRFQGGHNAGHTLVHGKEKVILHLLPSGILRQDTLCCIGNGVALSLPDLWHEIEKLEAFGLSVQDRLKISPACPLILPGHVALDKALEQHRNANSIGTTKRGIGPAYEDKVARRAIRLGDVFDSARFRAKMAENMDYQNFLLAHYFKVPTIDVEAAIEDTLTFGARIKSMVTDVTALLHEMHESNANLLFEGAQGFLLDIDHGTYPYVTSSNTTAAAAAIGSGLGPLHLDYVLGVTKAYTTRVGNGPFPTELLDKTGDWLADKGAEFGATTGRPRRCGWLDTVVLRRAVRANSLSGLCLTKLDVLDGLQTVRICTDYGGLETTGKPSFLMSGEDYEAVVPGYENMPGWQESTAGTLTFEALPRNARNYINRVGEIAGAPVTMVSTGPDRTQTIMLRHPFD